MADDGELYVFAQSHDRVTKERAMRRRQLKWLWKRLRQIATMEITREELLMKLGGARSKAPAAWRLVNVEIDKERPSFMSLTGAGDEGTPKPKPGNLNKKNGVIRQSNVMEHSLRIKPPSS